VIKLEFQTNACCFVKAFCSLGAEYLISRKMLLQQHFGARGFKSHLIICSNLQHALNLNYLHYFGRTHASGDLMAAADNLRPHASARWDKTITHLSMHSATNPARSNLHARRRYERKRALRRINRARRRNFALMTTRWVNRGL
jgi:hypothetical protein